MGRNFSFGQKKVHAGAYANVYLPLNWACSAHKSTFKYLFIFVCLFSKFFYGFYCFGRHLSEFLSKISTPIGTNMVSFSTSIMNNIFYIRFLPFFFSMPSFTQNPIITVCYTKYMYISVVKKIFFLADSKRHIGTVYGWHREQHTAIGSLI